MILDCKFKSIDHSQSLVDYTEERLQKLSKFEMKPETIHVTYYASRHHKVVEFCIQHHHEFIRAKASSDDFYESVDKAIHKLANQMRKRKKRVQNHKRFDHSSEAKILRLNPSLEIEHKPPRKRAG